MNKFYKYYIKTGLNFILPFIISYFLVIILTPEHKNPQILHWIFMITCFSLLFYMLFMFIIAICVEFYYDKTKKYPDWF